MPANKKGGKKFKRGKKDNLGDRKLILKDVKEDAGNIKKKTRINLYDVLLVSLWDFQDSKCSIIHKYEEDEVNKLRSHGEFPTNLKLEGDQTSDFFEDSSIHFDYGMPDTEEKEEEKESEEESEEDEIDMNDI